MDKLCYYCMTDTLRKGECTRCGRKPQKLGPKDTQVLPPGSTLSKGRFLVGAKLGRGGFGITYTGLDQKTGTPIAIKEFFPRHLVAGREGTALCYPADKEEEFERIVRSFRKEGDILNHLKRHPGIVNVKYRFDDNHTAYIGMELLEGIDLRQYVEQQPKPLSMAEAYRLLLPVMEAVQFIHENNVRHRDISPDNIFLCGDGKGGQVPKLIDFGAAHIAVSEFTQSYPNVKKSGYSPLEQNWVAEKQGPWSDVYSFAATLYYVLTGKVPTAAVERSGQKDSLLPPSKQGADISPEAEGVLLKGMAVLVQDRYPSMEAFRQAMEQALVPAKAPQSPISEHTAPSTETGPTPPAPAPKRDADPKGAYTASFGLRVLAYLGDLAVFCGGGGLLLGVHGLFLGLALMFVVNTVLTFLPTHGPLCMRLTHWRVRSTTTRDGAPTLGQCLMRSLVLTAVPFVVVEGLWMALSGNESMLHDEVTHTRLGPQDEKGPFTAYTASLPVSNPLSAPGGKQPPRPGILLQCREGVMAGQQWREERLLRIGRNKEHNNLAIAPGDGMVSKNHCVVYRKDAHFYIRDEGSKNGTYLNGERLSADSAPVRLKTGDTLRVGRCVFDITITG